MDRSAPIITAIKLLISASQNQTGAHRVSLGYYVCASKLIHQCSGVRVILYTFLSDRPISPSTTSMINTTQLIFSPRGQQCLILKIYMLLSLAPVL